jgi:hypothetical protein
MQAEHTHKHKALDQSSQARTDPEASKQYSDSFPVILFQSQEVMRPTAASAMLLIKKDLGVICSEAEGFYLLLSSMSESTFSRVLTATSIRDVWVILRKLYAG